jgi:hypothetical protein
LMKISKLSDIPITHSPGVLNRIIVASSLSLT